MKKEYTLLFVAAVAILGVMMASTVYAQGMGNSTNTMKPMSGIGIAVSSSDSTNFSPIAFAVNRNATSGFVSFNHERLGMSDISWSGSTLDATLQRNSTNVGSLSVTQVTNSTKWTGTMTLDGTTYNLYAFGSRFGFGMEMGGFHWGWYGMGPMMKGHGRMGR